MNILVIPTIRKHSLQDFLDKWQPFATWDKLIIVEDNPEPTFRVDCDAHYSWIDINTELDKDCWIISKRDSAIRSYGFYKAWQAGADFIFTLDDDCLPCDQQEDFCKTHIKNLTETPIWCESIPNYRTRGLPYKNLGKMQNVMFSMGLWEGVPDLDSIHMLTDHLVRPELPKTRVMPQGQYFPFCGMNFAFKREATPLAYFPLMGMESPYSRFDDIWFGVICKKICDHLNYAITVGEPYIYHSKASNAFVNLVKEAPGIKFNEDFWEIIDQCKLYGNTPVECMTELGTQLKHNDCEYISKLGAAMCIWSGLFANPCNNSN